MSNKEKKKSKKRNIKCIKCNFYDKEYDYCEKKDIENCSQEHTDFSKCDEYLVREDLVMF